MVLAFLAALGAFVIAWLSAGYVIRLAADGCLMDMPNARSAHQVPTPRGGGVGIVLGFVLATLALWFLHRVSGEALSVILGSGTVIAGVGFLDDFGHVAIRWRLLVQAGAVCLGLALLFPSGSPPFMPQWLAVGGVALGWLWLVNLYNFMDGIDGLAAVEAVTVTMAAAVIMMTGHAFDLATWAVTLVAACGGFLLWNWPPARIFMGDVGSGFLGYALGALTLISSQNGVMNGWSWGILLAVFITDATITLLRRMWRGDRWWRPHCSHAYQHLARRHGHLVVAVSVGVINWVWLLPWAWLAVAFPGWGGLWMALAYTPLVAVVIHARAGLPPDGGMK